MYHDATVPISPSWSAGALGANKTIFNSKNITGVRCFVEDMSECFIELLVAIVRNFHNPIFYTEGIGEIIPKFMSGDFYFPAFQVLAIEKLFPFTVVLC